MALDVRSMPFVFTTTKSLRLSASATRSQEEIPHVHEAFRRETVVRTALQRDARFPPADSWNAFRRRSGRGAVFALLCAERRPGAAHHRHASTHLSARIH